MERDVYGLGEEEVDLGSTESRTAVVEKVAAAIPEMISSLTEDADIDGVCLNIAYVLTFEYGMAPSDAFGVSREAIFTRIDPERADTELMLSGDKIVLKPLTDKSQVN